MSRIFYSSAHGPAAPTSAGGDSKRLLASVWVWVTNGEHVIAPAIRHLHTRWPLISAL